MAHQKYFQAPSDLTSSEWEFIRNFLPPPAAVGRHRANDRRTLNGILYVLSTGCRWEDLPRERYGSGVTCWRRLRTWEQDGMWNRIAVNLLRELDRKGKLNFRSGYLDTSSREAKRGQKILQVTRQNTGKMA